MLHTGFSRRMCKFLRRMRIRIKKNLLHSGKQRWKRLGLLKIGLDDLYTIGKVVGLRVAACGSHSLVSGEQPSQHFLSDTPASPGHQNGHFRTPLQSNCFDPSLSWWVRSGKWV